MGFYSCFVRLTTDTATVLQRIYPFRGASKQSNEVQIALEYVSVEVRLLSGEHTILRMESSQQLRTVLDLVTSETGIAQSCQYVVVSETRCKSRSLGVTVRELAHSWKGRKSTKTLILGLMNYMFLPQLVGREFGSKGLYHWAKAGLQQGLKKRLQGMITLQVHMLDGHALLVDMLGESSLQETQTMVQQEAGILLDRQRITIEECLPPSKLMQLSSQLLLGSISGLRAAGQAACWALHTLRGQMPDPTHFPLAVKTHLGQHVTVDATMDMTLAELHDAVNHRLSVAPTQPVSDFPIQEVTVHLVKTPDASSVRDAASASRYSFSEGKVSEGYGVTCR